MRPTVTPRRRRTASSRARISSRIWLALHSTTRGGLGWAKASIPSTSAFSRSTSRMTTSQYSFRAGGNVDSAMRSCAAPSGLHRAIHEGDEGRGGSQEARQRLAVSGGGRYSQQLFAGRIEEGDPEIAVHDHQPILQTLEEVLVIHLCAGEALHAFDLLSRALRQWLRASLSRRAGAIITQ